MADSTLSPFSLFAPPYRDFLAFDPRDGFLSRFDALCGVALVWCMEFGHGEEEVDLATRRPAGVPLVVVLPPVALVRRMKGRVLATMEEARPNSILPFHPRPDPEEVGLLLRREPERFAEELLDYLVWRGIPTDLETRRIIRRIMELSDTLRTLSGLARGVYLSRRALGRRFRDRGLPVPSHWLQFCRLLRAAIHLQNSEDSLHEISRALGYPDGFTLSNQMERIVGVRPSTVRERLGWEWLVECWLRKERSTGGLDVPLRGVDSGRHAAISPRPVPDLPGTLELTDLRHLSGAERSEAAA